MINRIIEYQVARSPRVTGNDARRSENVNDALRESIRLISQFSRNPISGISGRTD